MAHLGPHPAGFGTTTHKGPVEACPSCEPSAYDFEVPRRPVTDEEIAALPVLHLDDFHQEQQ